MVLQGKGWQLRSDNPDRPSFEATEATVPVAVLVDSCAPESLAPASGTSFTTLEDAAEAFGLDSAPTTGRHDGHLFLCVEGPAPWRVPAIEPRPGETAFVLVRESGAWRYARVARWDEAVAGWR